MRTQHQITCRTKKATKKIGMDGGRNRCARKSGSDIGKAEIVTNDGVGTWTRRESKRISR